MLFNVPQFIDIEDKIVGPLTAKQLGWLAAGALVLFFLWNSLDFSAFLLYGVPVAMLFAALAFYRPYGQPLIKFIWSTLVFFIRPKMYVWRRIAESFHHEKLPAIPKVEKTKPRIPQDKLKEVSSLLDITKQK